MRDSRAPSDNPTSVARVECHNQGSQPHRPIINLMPGRGAEGRAEAESGGRLDYLLGKLREWGLAR